MTIPAELRALLQWLCWRREQREDKPTKVPIDSHTGASPTNDATTWSSYEEAVTAVAASAATAWASSLRG